MTNEHEHVPDAQSAPAAQPTGDRDAIAAHSSEQNPLDHIGEPVPDPLVEGPPATVREG